MNLWNRIVEFYKHQMTGKKKKNREELPSLDKDQEKYREYFGGITDRYLIHHDYDPDVEKRMVTSFSLTGNMTLILSIIAKRRMRLIKRK